MDELGGSDGQRADRDRAEYGCGWLHAEQLGLHRVAQRGIGSGALGCHCRGGLGKRGLGLRRCGTGSLYRIKVSMKRSARALWQRADPAFNRRVELLGGVIEHSHGPSIAQTGAPVCDNCVKIVGDSVR
jgi:hypothetical protein